MSVQVVWWWPPSDWSFGYWRWPEWWADAYVPKDFGFRAISLGPIEFRYWPMKP